MTITGDGAAVTGNQAAAAADQNVDAKEAEKKDTWVDRFAGSSFFTQVSANLNVFAPALQQTRNPTVEQWSSLSPRYALNKDWQLRGRLVATYEYTNSDETTRRNEFRFGDANAQLFYRGIPSFLHGTKLAVNLGVTLPLSPESQARTMYFAPSLGLQLAHPFERVLGGDVTLIASASYSHPFYKYKTAGLDNPPSYSPQCFGADGSCTGQVSGAANVSDSFSWTVLATGEWGKFSPGLLLWITHSAPYQFKDIAGVERLGNRTALRQSTYLAAWLDYSVNAWLTPEIGYQFSRSVLDADGSYGNPIFSRFQDMRVYLGANIGLDSLYKSITGKGGESGVVRANNEMRPVLAL